MTSHSGLDGVRRAAGFLTVDEVAALAPRVLVLDPHSVLISARVDLDDGVVLYPGVVLETRNGGSVSVGPGTRIGPGAVAVLASDGALVEIGAGARLGPGSVTIVATGPTNTVRVGEATRLHGGAFVEGPAELGAGSQVLGAVAARDVVLGVGGSFDEVDPDRRGGVLKGSGRAHGVRLGMGEVLVVGPGTGGASVERQRAHHPDAPRR